MRDEHRVVTRPEKPGVLTGQTPVFNATAAGESGYEINNKQFSPSIGLAWQMPKADGPLSWLIGKSGSVRIEIDNSAKLAIIVTIVTSDGTSLVKPADCFACDNVERSAPIRRCRPRYSVYRLE